jgi:putative nucleotidyltransferase with HDIG domain
MAIPLIWQDAVPGAILMAGRDRDETFGRGERMLVSFVADVTAMTVSGFEDRRALEDVYLGTMATLMETVEAKDIYTRGHTDRVTELAGALARAVGIKGEQLEEIKRAAALHDIGKIALPDRIILKPGPLTIDERAMLQEHSERAEKILQHLKFLDSVRIIVRAHHEKYDGSGYPDGLRGEEAPLGARILAIVDAFDAMTSVRPYRQAMSTWDALEEIENNSGKQFDPKLSAVFLDIVRKGECPLPGSTAEGEEVLKGQGRSGS